MTYVRLQLKAGRVVNVPLGQVALTEISPGEFVVGLQIMGQTAPGVDVEAVWMGGRWVDPSWDAIDRAALESLGVGQAMNVGGKLLGGVRAMLATQLDTPRQGG